MAQPPWGTRVALPVHEARPAAPQVPDRHHEVCRRAAATMTGGDRLGCEESGRRSVKVPQSVTWPTPAGGLASRLLPN